MVIEVTFKGNRREFFEWPFPEAPAAKTAVIVEAERGEDFGRVHATGELALARKAGTTHGKASPDPLRKILRAASGDEITKATHLRDDEKNVRTRAIEKVRTLGLDMKISDTEWQHDKKRLTVYFTAEQRVDFRNLVRQLEGLFGTRVHMWHIGVRDEAKRVDGLGRCGRQLCSASWLPELVPVKSSVAKDQHLSTLNPAQISGACGRLMCCLRYEHEFYVQQRKRFPKEGKVVKTLIGEEKVVSLDIFRETVTLRQMGGDSRVVPLAELQREMGGTTSQPITLVTPAELEHEHDDFVSGLTGEFHIPREIVLEDEGDHEVAGEGKPAPSAPAARPEQNQQRAPRPREQQRSREQRPPQQRQQQQRPPQQRQQQPTQQQQPQPDSGQERDQPQGTPGQAGQPNQPGEGGGRRRRRGRRGGRRGRGGGGGPPGQSTDHGPRSSGPNPPPSGPSVV